MSTLSKSRRAFIPLLRGGVGAPIKQMLRYLDLGVTGREAQARQRAALREVNQFLQQASDLPGRADSKVAMHLFDRRVRPSSKEGITARLILAAFFALAPTALLAQQDKIQPEAPQKQTEEAKEAKPQTGEDGKLIAVPGGKALGMSILGNQEAPKALVIVPWKRSELGNVIGISTMLDDSKLPVDKEVFMRMLSYYEIRSGTTKTNSAQPAAATSRRKQ